MLGKKLFLTTFCGLLWWSSCVSAAGIWERVDFKALTNTDTYVLQDGRQVRLFGVKALDLDNPAQSEKCLTETVKLNLESVLSTHDLKIQRLPGQAKRVHTSLVRMKFGSNDLAKYLVSSGFAVATTTEYKAAEVEARKNHHGRWGQCDPHLNIVKWKKARGRTDWFWNRYHTYLTGSSVGRVQSVLSGNLILLDNGLKIHLQDVEMPVSEKKLSAYQCFNDQSREYLSGLVLGRKVYFPANNLLIEEYKTLPRQVYLPATSWSGPVWINHRMIEAGYGRASSGSVLEDVQKVVWGNPRGAWVSCLDDKFVVSPIEEIKAPALIYDELCPIKGNISGSKKNPKKTYHTPASGWYKRLKHEQCFGTEEAAVSTGFTKVR